MTIHKIADVCRHDYHRQTLESNDTEIVLLSCDNDQAAFDEWFGQQPWAAAPYEVAQGENGKAPIGYVRKAKRDAGKPQGTLGEHFKLASVPQLIVLDGATGTVVTDKPMEQAGTKSDQGYNWTDLAPETWLK
uniref:Thioredoxin-like fold domain-containing protein n=1 Tax=Oxyrrhis marina TaxID=2969 RepID=A0A7S3UL56_OXYMA